MTPELDQLKQDPYWTTHVLVTAELLGIEETQVAADIIKIAAEPALKSFKGVELYLQAAHIWTARGYRPIANPTVPHTIRVVSVEPARQTVNKKGEKNRLGSVQGIIQSSKPGSKVGLGTISFWGDEADAAANAKVDGVYEVNVNGRYVQGSGYDLLGTRAVKFDKPADLPETSPFKLPITELLGKLCPLVSCNAIKPHIGKIVQLRGRVVFMSVRQNKQKTGSYGSYTIADDSLTPKDVAEGKSVRIMMNPEYVKYPEGSDIIIVTQITNSPEYGLGGQGKLVIPISVVARANGSGGEDATAGQDKPLDFQNWDEGDEAPAATGGVTPSPAPEAPAVAAPAPGPSPDEFS